MLAWRVVIFVVHLCCFHLPRGAFSKKSLEQHLLVRYKVSIFRLATMIRDQLYIHRHVYHALSITGTIIET
jgi:hypothetical protein